MVPTGNVYGKNPSGSSAAARHWQCDLKISSELMERVGACYLEATTDVEPMPRLTGGGLEVLGICTLIRAI